MSDSHVITFKFLGWLGWDFWRGFTPVKWQARRIAKVLLRGPYKGIDLQTTKLLISGPLGNYRVTDSDGHVELCEPDNLPVGF